MANVVQFPVDDSSPTILYAPFGDTFGSPNLSAGWNPSWENTGFSSANIGAIGTGTSLHITSLNGASLQIHWTGVGIELSGNVTNASYAITIDQQTPVNASSLGNLTAGTLFSAGNLSNGDHSLTLTVQTTEPDALFTFDSALISALPAPSNVSTLNFTQQVFNDTFNFIGEWSFADSSHQSTNAGDSAAMQFTGTAFQLMGSTSPQAGNYTVTLDNVTTSFSARSSFSEANSLLFFASGLDAQTTHHFNITNTQGATLVLPVGGASIWALDEPPSGASSGATSSPSPSSSPSSGLSSGTIAALVLAGVLLFFVAICALLYFFLYRPYRRRQLLQRQQAKEALDQDIESVLVMDIALDEPTKNFYNGASVAGPSRDRTSKRSGFTKWKEEVEGGLGSWGRGALGIAFRHSDSTGRKDVSRSDIEYDVGATSDGYKSTSSSSNAEYPAQGKGKARERSGRWPRRSRDKSLSPKFKLDLPLQPRSRSGSQSNAPSSNRPEPSVISSLSYLSSPSLHPTTLPPSPPPPPNRPSPYPNTHSRVGSEGGLLAHNDGLPSEAEPPLPPLPPLPPQPQPQSRPTDSRNDDRGSVREYDADDGRSILGDGSARIALRSLSPRTVETDNRTRTKRRAKKDRQMTSSPLANPSTLDESTSHPEGPDSLSLRTTSPFQVDFNQTDRRATGTSIQSRVRFHDVLEGNLQTGENQGRGPPAATEANRRQPSQAAPFRLTPQGSSDHLRNTSFLDFTSSSEGSVISRSNDPSSSSRSFGSLGAAARSHWSTEGSSNIVSIVPPPQPQSRWSATTAPGSDLQLQESNASSSDSNFPFPVSLPPSPYHPEGTFMPPPPTFATQLSGSHPRESALSSLNAHPTDLFSSIPTSPTDSDLPVSISDDIHFRRSDSEEHHLPAHPPLPPMPPQPPEEAPFIVQRVVGMHSSTASLGNTLSTPTPTAARFNTSPSAGSGPGSSPTSNMKGRDL
ncbi:hypothetical protein K438DRAFT_1810111 [Mycena galopus ATCC 62051]|nr:hypothetical protein K438DRAFT_1810111 [Mycena galopus ATCC 62051]